MQRHSVPRYTVEAILSGETSLEKSFLQSQLGPLGTNGRPFTSRLFQSSVQRCIYAVQYLSHRHKRDLALLSDQVDALAIAKQRVEFVDRNLTVGQIWIEFCRSAEFVSARPLPMLCMLPDRSRNKYSNKRPAVAAVQLNRPARRMLLTSTILGVVLLTAFAWFGGTPSYSLLQWKAMMAIASLPLVVPLATVFQFVTKPKTIGSSIRWSLGVLASQFLPVTTIFK